MIESELGLTTNETIYPLCCTADYYYGGRPDAQSHESKQSRMWTNTSIHSRRSSKRPLRHFRYESGANGTCKQHALGLIRSTSYVSYWNLQKSLTWPESLQNLAIAKADSSLH